MSWSVRLSLAGDEPARLEARRHQRHHDLFCCTVQTRWRDSAPFDRPAAVRSAMSATSAAKDPSPGSGRSDRRSDDQRTLPRHTVHFATALVAMRSVDAEHWAADKMHFECCVGHFSADRRRTAISSSDLEGDLLAHFVQPPAAVMSGSYQRKPATAKPTYCTSPLRLKKKKKKKIGRGQDGKGEERGEGPQEGAGEGEGWEFVISATTTTTASSRWRETTTTTTTTASSRRATTTTTTTRADIFFFDSLLKGEEPPHTSGGRVFLPRCSTWSSGHTRRRLGRRGDSFRHALSFCGVSCTYEEFNSVLVCLCGACGCLR